MQNITNPVAPTSNNMSPAVPKTPKKNWLMIGLYIFGAYLITSGISLAGFSLLGKSRVGISPQEIGQTRSRIDPNAPKTEICPMNGLKYTKGERDIWEGRRPITAVIENHLDSRPQSGLSRADVVYEAVAEGGITRFLGVFYCGASAEDVRIGPIRSARIYFINWAAEWADKPLFVHVGGANNICSQCPGGVKTPGTTAKEVRAIEELINLGWRFSKGNALDAGTNVGFPVVWRDYERIPGAATEHTFMGSTDKLYEEGSGRGYGPTDSEGNSWDDDFTLWKFAEDKPIASPKYNEISFEFWSNKPDYNVTWKYDKASNSYLRVNGGKDHIDMDTKEQLLAKNVLVQFVAERGPVDKEGHMFYTNVGSGTFTLFQNGDVIDGTWSKKTQSDRTIYKVGAKEVEFVNGTIWIEAIPIGNDLSY